MSKKVKDFDYYFREGVTPAKERLPASPYFQVTKMEPGDSTPLDVYTIRWDTKGHPHCDCPAFHNYPERGPCKHILWMNRYKAVKQKQAYQDVAIYYSSGRDAFFPLEGGGTSAITDFLDKNKT